MLNIGCILVYLRYYILNLMPLAVCPKVLMVYPKVLKRVDVYRYIPCLAPVTERETARVCGGFSPTMVPQC